MGNFRRKIFLILILIVFTLGAGTALYIWKSKHYVMPKGYAEAIKVWEQKGLASPDQRKADGSEQYPYDVVVWGTDPEGITAALAAARNGLHTLLIDHRDKVGGLFTLGQLNFIDLNYDEYHDLVTRGIFEEFYKKVGGMVFDVDRGQQVFEEMLAKEKLLTVQLNRTMVEPRVKDGRVVSLVVENRDTQEEIYAKIFIDASQDADLAFLAEVPFTEGFEDIGLPGKFQASTLVFTVKGVNWPRVMWETLFVDKRISSKATFTAAWGYDDHIRKYTPESDRISFRGFNMARQKDGQVLINGLLIYGVRFDDPQSRAEGREIAMKEAYNFVSYARENLPGFQKAEVSAFAPELYVRQSRHMLGLYRLSLDDVLEHRDHWDRIGYGGYPVDIQAVDKHFPGLAIGEPTKYAVPFRSLVPPNVINLLVVGRSASYDSLAHGSARIVPVGMVGAQAAGVAAAYSLAAQTSFHEIAQNQEAIIFIRQILESQGAFVGPPRTKPPKIMEHPQYPAMRELRELGIIVGGYKNNYRLDEPLNSQTFLNLLFNGTLRTLNLQGRPDLAKKMYFVTAKENTTVTSENVGEIFAHFLKFNPHLTGLVGKEDLEELFTNAVFGASSSTELPRGDLYEVISQYLSLLKQNQQPGGQN
ncbi:MAG: FAD-dependent oxidoreductase [Bacillota bacterium]